VNLKGKENMAVECGEAYEALNTAKEGCLSIGNTEMMWKNGLVSLFFRFVSFLFFVLRKTTVFLLLPAIRTGK